MMKSGQKEQSVKEVTQKVGAEQNTVLQAMLMLGNSSVCAIYELSLTKDKSYSTPK